MKNYLEFFILVGSRVFLVFFFLSIHVFYKVFTAYMSTFNQYLYSSFTLTSLIYNFMVNENNREKSNAFR